MCEQLAQSCYVERSGRDSNLRLLGCKSDTLTTIRHHARHTFIEGGLKFKKICILGLDRARVCGYFVIHEMELIQIYPCTEFEMPGFIRSKDVEVQSNAISR